LSIEELEQINRDRHEVIYKPGETIFKQNSPLTHVMSMNRGLAKMYIQGGDNRDFILRIVKPVEFVAGVGLFLDNKHHYTLSAIDEVEICLIDSITFKQILKSNPAFNEAYIHHIHYNIADSLKKMISINQKNTKGRFAESILYLSDEIYQSDSFKTHLTKIELSELAGISRESAFKIMNELHTAMIVNFDGNEIHILNRPLLLKISEKG
jgi:CRP/FNR family transcriptional regulator